MKYAIIYHANCNDGAVAAAVAYGALTPSNNQIETFAVNYGFDFPDAIDSSYRRVFIVDFAFPPDVLEKVAEQYSDVNFVTIDHHASAIEKYNDYEMPDNCDFEFETGPSISGASLTWGFFHNTPKPDLVLDVADRDTWVFDRKNSKVTHQALINLDSRDPEVLWKDFLSTKVKENYAKLVDFGRPFQRSWDKTLEEISEMAFYRTYSVGPLKGQPCVLVNAPYKYLSDAAEWIRQNDERCTDEVLFIGFVVRKNGVSLSFRSEKGTDFARQRAQAFGGGGHDQSAGANIQFGQFMDILTGGRSWRPKNIQHFFVVSENALKPWLCSDKRWAEAVLKSSRIELETKLEQNTLTLIQLKVGDRDLQRRELSSLKDLSLIVYKSVDGELETVHVKDKRYEKSVTQEVVKVTQGQK